MILTTDWGLQQACIAAKTSYLCSSILLAKSQGQLTVEMSARLPAYPCQKHPRHANVKCVSVEKRLAETWLLALLIMAPTTTWQPAKVILSMMKAGRRRVPFSGVTGGVTLSGNFMHSTHSCCQVIRDNGVGDIQKQLNESVDNFSSTFKENRRVSIPQDSICTVVNIICNIIRFNNAVFHFEPL